ncbi:hypothetical protein [Pseudoalteromonas luteoviolacea]|uniref:Lipoprotein n=1 Tax=Pseudoalteromonas luteoviolacea S4060-1 TaxID=1365257 RepID=A0A167JMU8_9GAMM|nr:hypothetical protein [Pseudoalteromonas luteoviolacea]KZN61376.1 hypothetical protein N478_04730 [Pseudoalteromonas luteoviolacea S4060-1]
MFKVYAKLFVVAFFVSGCATTTVEYQEPTVGERAKVRFVSSGHHGGEAVVVGFDNAECANGTNRVSLYAKMHGNFTKSKKVGVPLWTYGDYAANAKEYYFEANKPNNFLIFKRPGGLGVSLSCGSFVSTTFEKDKSYEVDFNTNGCLSVVYEIKENEGEYSRVLKSIGNVNIASMPNACITEYNSRVRTRVPLNN